MEQRSFKISVECEKPERKQMAEVAQLADVVFYSKLWAEVGIVHPPYMAYTNNLSRQMATTAPWSFYKINS